MSAQAEATLRLMDTVESDIAQLDRGVRGALYGFVHKFRRNPGAPELRLRQLNGDSRLYSAVVDDDHRALLLQVAGSDYLLVGVKMLGELKAGLKLFTYRINPVTGGIEFLDVAKAEAVVDGSGAKPLFAPFSDEELLQLGVAEPLLGSIRKVTTERDLRALLAQAPQLTREVLEALHQGRTFDEVLDDIIRPVRAEQVDTEDYQAAATRPATMVTTDDTDLQAILEKEFPRWQVFLHPAQKKIVERSYNGPARVSGGPGTGKTVVALHRVKHLVQELGPGRGKPVLLTTFNTNLAGNLERLLLQLGGKELAERVEVVNIDKLAHRIVAQSGPGASRMLISDNKALAEWRAMLSDEDSPGWDAEFLMSEWSHVIVGHAINSRADYFRARRAGRGRALTRGDRAEIWKLAEKFTKRLDDKNMWTHRQVAERAARIAIEEARRIESYEAAKDAAGAVLVHRENQSGVWLQHRYRHVVVDEAQDLNAAHWKMIRALVPPGPDDIFIAGDTHQRIYDNYVSLGSLGINIRGRSSKLTLSYRITGETLESATRLIVGEEFDDLDGGIDELRGYQSVLHGPSPEFRSYPDWEAETAGIAETIRGWREDKVAWSAIAVCVPERDRVAEVAWLLADRAKIPVVEIGPEGPRGDSGVHIGTMHRFKGLEYQRMIISGISDGLVPQHRIEAFKESDPVRYRRERQRARSLLFVAVTRARDAVVISWHGNPSPFLPRER